MSFYPGYAPEWFHALTDTFSLLIAGYYYTRLALQKDSDRTPEKDNIRVVLLIGAGIGALIGSRLIASLENPALFFNPPTWLYYYSVKTVAGGIAGGILGIEIVKKILHIKKSVGDIMVGPIALGIIIGRIGCFMVGARDGTVGLVTSLPWGLDLGDGLLRHPTSLYEIIVVSLLWLLISRLRKKASHSMYEGTGFYFRLFCIGYFGFRFFVEFIKPVHPLILGLTAIQIVSAYIVIYYGQSLLRKKLL